MITVFITNRVIKIALAALPSLPAADEGWAPPWLQIESISSLGIHGIWVAVWASLVSEGAANTYRFKKGRWKEK